MAQGVRIRELVAPDRMQLRALTELLIDCVEGGASVGFMLPLAQRAAQDFWSDIASRVVRGERLLLIAEGEDGTLAGTVQLVLQQFENQAHRVDLAKMLVHRRARRQGVGTALLRAAEQAARSAGRSLLVLDTASPEAERIYVREGWQRCGRIPNYALWPQGGFCPTTILYKQLAG